MDLKFVKNFMRRDATLSYLGEMKNYFLNYLENLIAFFIGVVIFRFLKNSIGSLASVPPEIDPTDVLETSQSFLCKACGTELTVKLQSVVANEPPKHCKEEMTPIEY